jgi:hypothetical protein
MKRSALEHIIRAAGSIANDSEIVVIGSQPILGQFPNAPASLLVSAEADVFPMHNPQLSDLIDGSIGEGSPFHEMYGYYAQGVDDRTATLPRGWRERDSRLQEIRKVKLTLEPETERLRLTRVGARLKNAGGPQSPSGSESTRA